MSLFDLEITILDNYTDWRLPENRKEAFRRVAYVRLKEGDLDHHHVGKVIVERENLTNEQKALYCLIFGQSYRNHWAHIVLSEFPDLLKTPYEELKNWHDKNWQRAKYAKDTKWGLRKFPDYVESIKKKVGSSAYEYFGNKASVGNTSENYYSLNNSLTELYGIGRMTAWLTQQTFYEFFNWDIDHWDLQLYDDTWSQYDALCYLYDRLDLSGKGLDGEKRKPSKENIKLMEENFIDLMTYCNQNSDLHMDVYNIESCLCEYRKTAAPTRKPKEFTFYTTVELSQQFQEIYYNWPEINWDSYALGLYAKGENVRNFYYSTEYFRVMLDYGLNLNTHYYFDEPDAYEVLSLPRTIDPSSKFLLDYTKKFSLEEIEKYHARNYIRV